jgi:UDP-N-acetylmuramoyl-L-alanyl-D-glutamate--2,6-diaminopimelate ligase
MRLKALLQALPDARVLAGVRDGNPEIVQLVADSRLMGPGGLFIAIRGQHSDGHAFIQDAVRRGAAAVVMEEAGIPLPAEGTVPVVTVKDSRLALALLADRFHDHPSLSLSMIGVTGTNGKTTVTYLIRSILKAAGHRVGLLGTVAYELDDEKLPSTRTTPEAHVLQALLARLVKKGAQDVVMEVSSHALVLDRVEGCDFDAAVFTNLTQDHLDFHQTMENYFESKQKLFSGLARPTRKSRPKRAVINRDDSWGRKLIESTKAPVWTYGLDEQADITARDIRGSLEGLTFTAVTPLGSFEVKSSLVGRHNVYNLLAAVGAAIHLGIPAGLIVRGIEQLDFVPGRFERLDSGLGFSMIVDYAHTEDAMERLLRTAADLTPGRVITVFGCGGDRDRGKRAPMGRTAARLSDVVIITSDNPRSEDPARIIHEVEVGVQEGSALKKSKLQVITIPDRKAAIERALELARPGDAVIVAGKGHEEYQIIGDRILPFDDRQVGRDWIGKHRSGTGARGA